MTMILRFSAQILCCAMLVIVPLLLGTLGNLFIKVKKISMPTTYVTGLFAMLLIFEGVVIVALKLDLPFSVLTYLFSILMLIICGSAFFVTKQLRIRKGFEWKNILLDQKKDIVILCILWVIIFFAQIAVSFYFSPIVQEDNTMEIVQTTLTTNSIHMYNAMTGQASVNGIAMQGKFMALPLFYAYICRVFRLNPGVFLYRIVPTWILILSYMVYADWAGQMFRTEEDKPDTLAATVFVVLYAVLLFFGDFLFTTIPYRIFHCAWAGETVVVAIVLPFIISQCLQLRNKKKAAIFSISISGMSVFILVSLQKGITYLTLTGIIMLLVFLITKVRRPKTCKNS